MLNEFQFAKFKEALCYFLEKEKAVRELRIAEISEMSFQHQETDFGIDYFSLVFRLSPIEYIEYSQDIEIIQNNLTVACKLLLKDVGDVAFTSAVVAPKYDGPIMNKSISNSEKTEIERQLNDAKAILISVATGGPRIQEKNEEYIGLVKDINAKLDSLGLDSTKLYKDLWDWYGVWSNGQYPSYQSRRVFINNLVNAVIVEIGKIEVGELHEIEISGRQRLDRTIREIRYRFSEAKNEEQFQAIGVLCRDALVTLAQEVYVDEKYKAYCDKVPSTTDAKRMIDAFLQCELLGSVNETLRRYAKAANDLANELTHKRTANKKDTIICINATFSIVDIVLAIFDDIDDIQF